MAHLMRVAFDATALLGPRTGVGTFASEVITRLAARDELDVVAYAATWRGRGGLRGLVPATVAVTTRPMAARPLRAAWRRADVPPIEWWTGPVDVVHGPNFVVPPTRRAAALVTVHDLTFLHFPAMVTRDVAQYGGLLRRSLRRGAHVHAVSDFVASEVADAFGVEAARVHAVANGVTATPGDPPSGRAIAGAERYVLALGTVEPRKDLPTLVEAFDLLAADDPDVSLVIAGPDGWGTDALHRATTAARHRERIVRIGWVDDAGKGDLLAGAAAFAYPSRYEGFGLPPLEAMAAGTPVVTTRAGALPETVGDAALLVDVGDAAALADALRIAITDSDTRDELVAKGRARVSRYDWNRCADGIVDVYRHLQSIA
jgi:glycosyltransferase involved in cell wall biosynthesis